MLRDRTRACSRGCRPPRPRFRSARTPAGSRAGSGSTWTLRNSQQFDSEVVACSKVSRGPTMSRSRGPLPESRVTVAAARLPGTCLGRRHRWRGDRSEHGLPPGRGRRARRRPGRAGTSSAPGRRARRPVVCARSSPTRSTSSSACAACGRSSASRESFGQEIDLHQVGYLFLLDRPDHVEAFERNVALQNELGVASRMIDVAEAKRLSPLIEHRRTAGRRLVAQGRALHARVRRPRVRRGGPSRRRPPGPGLLGDRHRDRRRHITAVETSRGHHRDRHGGLRGRCLVARRSATWPGSTCRWSRCGGRS